MRRILLPLSLILMAAAPASYDAVCPGPCIASDGTAQASGTTLYRFLWDGLTTFVPRDSAGTVLSAILDAAQSRGVYQPAAGPVMPSPILTINGAAPDSSGNSTLAIPAPLGTVPPAPTSTGSAGSGLTYIPGNATMPSLTRSTTTTTASDGTFSVTWATPLVSAVPPANVIPINAGTQPIDCNVTSRSASTVAGKCWTLQTTSLTLSIITSGINLSPTTNSAGGISIMVVAREPSQ